MRCRLILVGIAFLSQGAVAEPTRDEVVSGVARCAGVADNRSWLDCFYGSAQPMRALLGLSPAPPAQTKLVPPQGAAYLRPEANPYTRPQKSGGFFADLLGSSKPIASDVPMESYKFARNGTFTAVLKNGETYQQLESDTVPAKWNKPAGSYLVTIIGSSENFVLKVKGQPGVSFRVRRM